MRARQVKHCDFSLTRVVPESLADAVLHKAYTNPQALPTFYFFYLYVNRKKKKQQAETFSNECDVT